MLCLWRSFSFQRLLYSLKSTSLSSIEVPLSNLAMSIHRLLRCANKLFWSFCISPPAKPKFSKVQTITAQSHSRAYETPTSLSHSKYHKIFINLLTNIMQAFILLFPDIMSKLRLYGWWRSPHGVNSPCINVEIWWAATNKGNSRHFARGVSKVAALLSGLLPKVPLPAQTAKKPVFLHAEIAGKTTYETDVWDALRRIRRMGRP